MWSQLCGNHYTHVVHRTCAYGKAPRNVDVWADDRRFTGSGERGWRGTVSHLLTTHFKRCTQRYLEVFPLYICVGITPDKSLSHNTSRICFQPRERFKKRQYFSTSPYSDVHTPTFKGPSVYKRGTLRHLGTRAIGGTEFLLEVNFCYPVFWPFMRRLCTFTTCKWPNKEVNL